MISELKKKPKTLTILLVLALAVLFAFQTNLVLADIPDVTSVEPWTSGTDTILNITVRHASPTPTHYVDAVEVDIDGTVEAVYLEGQSTETFLAQYNMGEVTDTPAVQARAFCTWHGWSSWSQPVVVPEFSTIYLFLFLAFVSIAILLVRSKQ
ncbi:MAG: hypothetical protein JSV75_04325 [Candidatus Bathyarchaeota archaeon]|nr:MAG: hypothetical protein JSW72_01835 [Candidatus Bathyarchaeota archaeon]UCD26136.1 MAG: hypothetical protein JSV75_04325 [Candidatus Bathyarchaeota archaeon]